MSTLNNKQDRGVQESVRCSVMKKKRKNAIKIVKYVFKKSYYKLYTKYLFADLMVLQNGRTKEQTKKKQKKEKKTAWNEEARKKNKLKCWEGKSSKII